MTHQITVVGLGVGELEQLPYGIYKLLKETKQPVYLRTADHPVVSELMAEGMKFTSFDFIYEKHDQFEGVYGEIVATLLEQAVTEPIIYAVPVIHSSPKVPYNNYSHRQKTSTSLVVKVFSTRCLLRSVWIRLKDFSCWMRLRLRLTKHKFDSIY